MLARQANCVHVGQRESEVICNLNRENGFIYTREFSASECVICSIKQSFKNIMLFYRFELRLWPWPITLFRFSAKEEKIIIKI